MAVTNVTNATPALLSQGQVATRLGVSIETVRRLGRSGELRRVRVGGQWRVEDSELAAYIERNRQPERKARP